MHMMIERPQLHKCQVFLVGFVSHLLAVIINQVCVELCNGQPASHNAISHSHWLW